MNDADHEIYCYFCQEILKNGREGWWLALGVGGEKTCAYNASRGFLPPIKGWQVFDGEDKRSEDGVALVAVKPPGIVPHTSASASSAGADGTAAVIATEHDHTTTSAIATEHGHTPTSATYSVSVSWARDCDCGSSRARKEHRK